MIAPRPTPRSVAAAALCLALLAPAAASAQQVDPQRVAAAQTLYEQATADMDAKRYDVACRKLEEVTRLVPEGLGAKLTLGDCYLATGKRASAWAQLVAVASLAARAGQLDRAARAADKARALAPTLATLTIEVPPALRALAGLTLTRDGVPVGDPQWGTAVPVDAGAHEIVIAAPGHDPLKMAVEVPADGAKVSVTALAPKPSPKAPPPPVRAARPWQRPTAIGALALGAVGVGVGAALGGLALSRNAASKRDGHCDAADFCDQTGFDLRGQARAFGNGSTAAIVAGGVVLAAGVVLFATAPRAGARAERSAALALLPGGLRLRGTW